MSWSQALLDWVQLHPGWAGVLIFFTAFTESLAVVGILIPGILILFGVGAMIGLELLNFYIIWAWASLGALCGDSLSYWLGHRFKTGLRNRWPFRHSPETLRRSEQFIERHGIKSVLLGRFIGPLRPLVPATAGMLGMPAARFFAIAVPACLLWSPVYLAPGVLLGASLDVAADYVGRLVLLVLLVVVLLSLLLWLIRLVYEWLVHRSARMSRHAIRWARRHPVMGRWYRGLLDPGQRGEVLSLTMLGLSLVLASVALLVLLLVTPFGQAPLAMDAWVADLSVAMRSHRSDELMIRLAQMGRWPVLVAVSAAMITWLAWRGRRVAAFHWLLVVAGAALLQLLFHWLMSYTPELASRPMIADRLPRAALLPATAVFGFFAVMVAPDMKRHHRRWPYLASGTLILSFALARLYLGLDGLTGVLTGFLMGGVWCALVGIAYRQRTLVRYPSWTTSTIFASCLLVAASTAAWKEQDAYPWSLPVDHQETRAADWWRDDWQLLPRIRSNVGSPASRDFNLQLSGSLTEVADQLLAAGWRQREQAGWSWVVYSLNPAADRRSMPLPGRDYRGTAEVLRLHLPDANDPGRVTSLRLWQSGLHLEDGSQVWLGQLVDETLERHLKLFSYWAAQPLAGDAGEILTRALPGWQVEARDDGYWWLLREAD